MVSSSLEFHSSPWRHRGGRIRPSARPTSPSHHLLLPPLGIAVGRVVGCKARCLWALSSLELIISPHTMHHLCGLRLNLMSCEYLVGRKPNVVTATATAAPRLSQVGRRSRSFTPAPLVFVLFFIGGVSPLACLSLPLSRSLRYAVRAAVGPPNHRGTCRQLSGP